MGRILSTFETAQRAGNLLNYGDSVTESVEPAAMVMAGENVSVTWPAEGEDIAAATATPFTAAVALVDVNASVSDANGCV